MKTGEKIAWGFIGLLIAGAVGICFLLNVWLGAVITVLAVGSFAFAYKGKGKIEKTIALTASELGLEYRPSQLTYGSIVGDYKGYRVKITAEGGADHMGTVQSFTRVGMKAQKNLGMKETVEQDGLKFMVYDHDVHLDLPYLCADPVELREYLDNLAGFIKSRPG